ncbi:MAG: hypothetical protein WDO16_04090, partial [Bacteroidota bacterium]
MDFKTVSIIKYPVNEVWIHLLNGLPRIAKKIEDLESITETERHVNGDGSIKIINIWKAKPKLPSFVVKRIKPDMLAWTDTAEWIEKQNNVQWKIQSHHFAEEMQCHGVTSFEPAMGGKGCRVTFSGNLQWKGKVISSGIGLLDATISKSAEGILSQMIPSNFRKITDALSTYIREQA